MGPKQGRKKKKGSDDDDDDDPLTDDPDFYAPPPPVPAAPAAPPSGGAPALVLIEELWAQCDRCQKWRLLPPGTTPPPDNVPWWEITDHDDAFHNFFMKQDVSWSA
jgi:hypothetical protein